MPLVIPPIHALGYAWATLIAQTFDPQLVLGKLLNQNQPLAIRTQPMRVRITACSQDTRPYVQQMVIGIILANDKISGRVVFLVAVYVMYMCSVWQRTPQCALSDSDVLTLAPAQHHVGIVPIGNRMALSHVWPPPRGEHVVRSHRALMVSGDFAHYLTRHS